MAQKTKKQKQQTDLRRTKPVQPVQTSVKQPEKSSPSISYSFVTPSKPVQPTPTFYAHNKKDLIKTGIITGSIVFLQLILFLLMQTHIIKISF